MIFNRIIICLNAIITLFRKRPQRKFRHIWNEIAIDQPAEIYLVIRQHDLDHGFNFSFITIFCSLGLDIDGSFIVAVIAFVYDPDIGVGIVL